MLACCVAGPYWSLYRSLVCRSALNMEPSRQDQDKLDLDAASCWQPVDPRADDNHKNNPTLGVHAFLCYSRILLRAAELAGTRSARLCLPNIFLTLDLVAGDLLRDFALLWGFLSRFCGADGPCRKLLPSPSPLNPWRARPWLIRLYCKGY